MDKKKLAAAMAAVFAYIKTSEESSAYQASQTAEFVQKSPAMSQQAIAQPNLWGISGRQFQMQASSMIQLRMFK